MSLVLGSRPSKQSMPQKENATMTRNIASDDKWVFEVRGGVLLVFGERINLADGCWFGTEGDPFGPFATDQEALDAAASASDETAELNNLATPSEPLPVTDPGEVVPLLRQRDETDLKIFQPVRSCRGARWLALLCRAQRILAAARPGERARRHDPRGALGRQED